jgi:hypothetical protein
VIDLIVVGTADGREEWVRDASASIKRPHIVVSREGEFELGVIRWCLDNERFDRLVFLQDSMVITDSTVFDRIAVTPGSICLNHAAHMHYSCHMGVYDRWALEAVGVPRVYNKHDSIYLGEWGWTLGYQAAAGAVTCFDHKQEWGEAVQLHGRNNVPHDTGYMIKYRATA